MIIFNYQSKNYLYILNLRNLDAGAAITIPTKMYTRQQIVFTKEVEAILSDFNKNS